MSGVDLHLHTTVSDGKLTPEELVRKAADNKLSVIAITDHDSVDGVEPALKAAESYPGLRVIPGVEISVDAPENEIHILGYFVDYNNPELCSTLEHLRNTRITRAQKMVEKLGTLGMPLEWKRVKEIAGDSSIGRPHVAQAMLEKGYINSIKEAFVKYLGHDGPAYVEREKMTPLEAEELILRAKGFPVLAHPLFLSDPEKVVAELKSGGLAGLEAYYSSYTPEQIKGLVGLAEKYGLIPTGGSDYHGLDPVNETPIGGVDVPLESAGRLIFLHDQRG